LGVITGWRLRSTGPVRTDHDLDGGRGWEHFWLANFSTAVYGTYTQVRYDDAIISSNLSARARTSFKLAVPVRSWLQLLDRGAVTNWYPWLASALRFTCSTRRIESAFDGQTLSLSKTQGCVRPAAYTAKDQGILSVVFRAQRSFATGE